METDHREQWVLREGDRIQCADAVYIISNDPIGYGGSAIVYPARRTDTHLSYAIKECFPQNGAYHRSGGVIMPRDLGDSASIRLLDSFRRGILTEQHTGQIIHNAGDRAICIREVLHPQSITFRGESYSPAHNGIFAVLDRMDLKSKSFNDLLDEIRRSCSPEELRLTMGLPDIHTTACLIEEVLTALDQVHTARDPERPEVSGYYFGDLHGGNIFFTGSHICEGTVGTAHLIDFGSTRELDERGFTEELRSEDLFSAKESRPPEMLTGGIVRLCRQSDIFSVGCLMLRCIATPQKLLSYPTPSCVGPDFLDAAEGAYIGCGPELLKLVNEIADRATARSIDRRYASAEEMLRQIRQLKEESTPVKNQLGLGLSTLADGAFVGRDSDRRKLDRFLENRLNPIILYGFPGIGKTELAIDYGRRKSRSARVYFVRFTRSFRETVTGPIADAFSGYSRSLADGRPKSEDQIYREILQLLGRCAPDDILIIDHADSPTGVFADLRTEAYEALCSLPMHLMLTTRSEPDGAGQWHEVGPLDRRSLHKLMLRHVSLPVEQLDSLIDAVDSHTLTLDLMARTMAQSWCEVTPEKLLNSLRSHDPGRLSLPQITTTHDRSNRQAQLYGHLKALFDLSGMSEDEITVLCCATLLPTDGMSAPLFKNCLREEAPQSPHPGAFSHFFRSSQTPRREQSALMRLTKTGWLTVTDHHLLCIHPVVREVCRAELSPNELHCGSFLQQLWEQYAASDFDAALYIQMADCFAASLALPASRDPYRASHAGVLYRKVGQYRKALEYAQTALDIGLSVFSGSDPALAVFYNNLGTACGDLGDYDRELEYQKLALRIREAALPPDHPDLAISYSNLGTSYGDRGDHRMELEYQQKALRIREAALPPDHPDIADSYTKVGNALCRLGDYRTGIDLQRKALQLRKAILPPNHPDLAASHNNLGKSLCEQGRYRESLEHLETALYIRQSQLPPLHPSLAQSHHNLGIVYGLQGNCRKELEHHLQCLKIRREILDGDDPRLIESCRNVAKSYGKLGEYENELEYFLQTLELQSASVPEDHPQLIQPYCHVALAYADLGIREQQLVYLRKAARAGHIGSMNNLANLLIPNQEFQEALYWLEQASSRGDASAANNLGLLFLKGLGVPRDLQKGRQLLLTAAQRGSRAANRHLGRLFLGCHPDAQDYSPVDPSRALQHLNLARDQGASGDEALIRQAETMVRIFASAQKTKTQAFQSTDILISAEELP